MGVRWSGWTRGFVGRLREGRKGRAMRDARRAIAAGGRGVAASRVGVA